MALSKVKGPFDRPFDKLTVLSKVEGLTALSKAEGPRWAASFVIAAYFSVHLIPQDLRALHLDLFSLPSDSDLFTKLSSLYQTNATEHYNLSPLSINMIVYFHIDFKPFLPCGKKGIQ